MKKNVIGIFLLLVSVSVIYAIININEANHSLDNLRVFENKGLDVDGNGIVDVCDSLSEPPSPINVDTNAPYHSLDQISLTPGDTTSVDEDENGWPDVCERMAPLLGVTIYNEKVFHDVSQISRSSTNDQSIDSDGNNWPDKGDCILSELSIDESNCGTCGNVCPEGIPCYGGICNQPVWVRIAYGSSHPLYTGGTDSDISILQEIEDIALGICDDAPNGCVNTSCNQVSYNSIVGSAGSFLDNTNCTDYQFGTCYCGWKSYTLSGVKFYSIFCRNHYCEFV